MLTMGLRLYRSSNLVLDLKMWENFESNLLVWICARRKSDVWGRTHTATQQLSKFIFKVFNSPLPIV